MLDKAKYLAAASAFEYALQFALPIVLARTLSSADFASWRFLWLVAGTVTGVLLLGLPQSLFYFLPRRDDAGRATLLLQTIGACTLLGALAALAVVVLAKLPWTEAAFALLPRDALAFALFLAALAGAAPYDQVAAAMQQIETQARIVVATAVTRVVAVLAGVALGSFEALMWALVVFALLRFALQWLFVARRLPLGAARVNAASLREQLDYALPFGLATGFWALRGQAEQWVGAVLLAAREFASLSVAGAMLPALLLVRNAITNSVFAELNRLESSSRHVEMLAVNGRANAMAAAILFPLLALLFALASPLIVLVYTPTYADAAGVTQLLVLGMLGSNFIETSSMAKALNLGRQLLGFDAAMLVVSLALSIAGGLAFGMLGIVIGSIVGRYASTIFCAWIVARRLDVPIARFQPWSLLSRTLLASVLAAGIGWWVVQRALVGSSLFAQIGAGSAAVALSYAALARALKVPLKPG